MKRQYIIYK